mgnify:FL=1
MTFLLHLCPTLTIENKQIPFYARGDWLQKCWNCEVKEKRRLLADGESLMLISKNSNSYVTINKSGLLKCLLNMKIVLMF